MTKVQFLRINAFIVKKWFVYTIRLGSDSFTSKNGLLVMTCE